MNYIKTIDESAVGGFKVEVDLNQKQTRSTADVGIATTELKQKKMD